VTDMSGRVVLVPGGSSGIGLATAKAFAARGADIGIIARDLGRLEAAREAVEGARASASQRVVAVPGDVGTMDGAQAAVSAVVDALGVPDVIVNTAGIIIPGHFETMPVDSFETCLRNGFLTCVYPSRAVAPLMMARGSGHIVNVSSVAGFLGVFGYTAYSPSKFAVMGFSEALRSEMRPHGVHVSVVCPPDTDTPGLAFEKTLRPLETDVVAGNIKAIPAEVVGEAIARGVEKGRYLIIPGAISKLYFRLKGLLPGLFFAVTDGDVDKARRQRASQAVETVADERA
jgi:3-dehydrosphinganine reductase